jgi:hypothetical protein
MATAATKHHRHRRALAGKGCASKAVSARDERAPAGDHAPTETAATEMHSTTEPTMNATESTLAVHATESIAAALCHGWRGKSNSRSKHGRGEAAKKFAFHISFSIKKSRQMGEPVPTAERAAGSGIPFINVTDL